MNELNITINEQLQQLQMMMHRTAFHHPGHPHNPHRGQGRILAILKLKPEISQKELTYLLDMSKQAVAALIAKLEKGGYLTREQDSEDKRAMLIRLTEKGTLAANGENEASDPSNTFLDCLSEEELNSFSGYLARMIKHSQEQFPDEDFEDRRRKRMAFMEHHGHSFEHNHHGCEERGHGHHHGMGRHGSGRDFDQAAKPGHSKCMDCKFRAAFFADGQQ